MKVSLISSMKRVIIVILAVGIISSLLYTILGTDSEAAYIKKIESERSETEAFMARDKESPFVVSGAVFEGLHYFEPDLNFRVKAEVEKIDVRSYLILPTSTGKEKSYLKYGYLKFSLFGNDLRLLALQPADEEVGFLFVPFTDETSAEQTYGAGRYLEIGFTDKPSSVVVDFNKAYNPYCAYVADYSCPLPPADNHLPVKITAGEKNYVE
jgi:hypothetical protein